VKESTDFSTQKWLSRIKTFRNILFVSGFATEIKQEQNGLIKILVRTSENSMQEIYAKKVLICCGPFGTQELLAKSGLLNSNPPQIRDHISYEVGDIQLSGVRLAKFGIFGWNRFRLINIKRCTTFFDERRNTMWTLRIFPESVLSLEMLIAKLKKAFAERKFVFCTSLIVKFTASFLTGKILIERIKVHISADFLDDSYPIKVASYGEGQRIDLLEYENDCIPISTEFRRFISRNVENLRLGVSSEVAMNLAEEIKFESINSSSHHMGTVWDVSKNSLASPLEISTDILVAGSSIFRASVPGHPTMLAAASAILAVDKIKSEID
jgi:hypothetical protein